MEKSKGKRIFSIVSVVISSLIFVFALTVFIITLTARSKKRPVELFGYSFAIVVTDSMEPEILVGDLIFVKSCSINDIKVGDNAVFIGTYGSYKDKCIVHKVIGTSTNENGEFCLITHGINNPESVTEEVVARDFIGREVKNSSALGKIFVFLKQPLNWLYILVILIAIFVISGQTVKLIKHFKNKKTDEETDGENKEE